MINRIEQKAGNSDAADRTTIVLIQAFSIALGVGYAFIDAASTALFIAEVGIRYLPSVFLGIAFAAILLAVFFHILRQQTALRTTLVICALGVAIGTVAIWYGLSLEHRGLPIYLVMVWASLVKGSTWALIWTVGSYATRRSRSGNRIGHVSNGELMARAVSYFVVVALAYRMTATAVVLAAFVAYGVAVVTLVILLLQAPTILPLRVRQQSPFYPLADFSANRSVFLVIASGFVATASQYLVLYQLLYQAATRFTTVSALMAFIGLFYGITTMAGLAARIGLTPTVLRRFGLPASLLLLPAALLLLTSAGLIGQTVTVGQLAGISVFALLLYLAYDVLRIAFYFPITANLRQMLPVPDGERHRYVTEYTVASAAIASIGALLLGLQTAGLLSWAVTLALIWLGTVVWLVISLQLSALYPQLLERLLQQRTVGTPAITFSDHVEYGTPDRNMLDILESALLHDDPAVQTYALETLAELAPVRLDSYLPGLLNSPADDVRLTALTAAVKLHADTLQEDVRRLANDDPAPDVRVYALFALAQIDPREAVALAVVQSDAPEPALQVAGLAVALRHGEPRIRADASARVRQLAGDANPGSRLSAAQVLQQSAQPEMIDLIQGLLNDPQFDVREAALDAAQRVNAPSLYPDVIAALAHPKLRVRGQSVLMAAGEDAIPWIEETLLDPSAPLAIRTALLDVCGVLDDSRTTALLLAQLTDVDMTVQDSALRALSKLNYRAGEYMRSRLIEQANQDLTEAAGLVRAITTIQTSPEIPKELGGLLLRAIDHGWRIRRDHALRRHGLILANASMDTAIAGINHPDAERRQLAHEFLQYGFPADLRARIRPFVRDMPPHDRDELLQKFYPQPNKNLTTTLIWTRDLAASSGQRWLTLCANYAIQQTTADATAPSTDDPGEQAMLTTIERVLLLRSVDLFTSVPDEVLAWVANVTVDVFIPRGERYITEGEWGDALFVVVSGDTDIVIEGKGTIATRGPRNVFGEMGVLTRKPRTASCVAATDIVALKLVREDFLDLMAETPELALGIIEVLVQRLDDVSRKAAMS